MASPFIPAPFMYGDIPSGGQLAIIVVSNSAPTTSNNQHAVGTFWLVPEPQGSGLLYCLIGFLNGVPQWDLVSNGSGPISSVVGTANEIDANTVASVVTLTIPAVFVAPGSIESTTDLTVGGKLNLDAAANGTVGTTAALTAGSIVVNNTSVTADSVIFFTTNTLGTVTVPQSYFVSARTPGVSFTVTSSDATDTSTVDFLIIN